MQSDVPPQTPREGARNWCIAELRYGESDTGDIALVCREFLALEAELCAKDAKIEQLGKNVQHWMEESFMWNKRSQQERAQLAEARSVIKFYADERSWSRPIGVGPALQYLAAHPETEKPAASEPDQK